MKIVSTKHIIGFICLSAILIFAAKIENEDKILGIWLVGNGNAKVKIEKVGKKFHGKIVWLKVPNDSKGKPKIDVNNPDESLKSKPIVGLSLMKDFVYEGGNVWKDGSIYDPESGKSYSCKITLTDANTLEVRGYVGVSLFGRTDTWTRVKE